MPITLFSKTSCQPCRVLKTWLNSKGLEYTEINLEDQPDRLNEMVERTGYTTFPTTIIGDTIVPGFNLSYIRQLLNI